jgi:hypothetical protein
LSHWHHNRRIHMPTGDGSYWRFKAVIAHPYQGRVKIQQTPPGPDQRPPIGKGKPQGKV